jgi:S-DNA-T family DNA segregation ATPase FtsK/SpoIIIE
MRKGKEQVELNLAKQPFIIPQFVKLEGIRGKLKYEKDRFVSPIFGRSVKDVVTVPFTIKDTGDTTRRFDAFRTQPKLSEQEAIKKHGNKYYEFTNIVSMKTREDYFGPSSYEPSQDQDTEKKPDKKVFKPIAKSVKEVHREDPMPFKVQPEPKRTVAYVPPVMEEKKVESEPRFETYRRKEVEKPIVTSDFGSTYQPEPQEDDIPYSQPRFQPERQKTYFYPPVTLFSKKQRDLDEKPAWLLDQIDVINSTLNQFGVEGEVSGSKKGPTVTRYEIALEPGVNVKRVTSIQENLMMNLASKSIRIEAPIPGKPYVGIEVPNVKTEIVAFGNVVDTKDFMDDHDHPLKVALGVDIDGENIYVDIQAMPHGLIAGATNSGKSVCVNTVLVSLLIKNSPEDLKLILIDPKMVELTPYNGLPHLVTPVITDVKMAAAALNWAVNEMEKRYQLFAGSRSRDIKTFNDNVRRGLVEHSKMPYIVIVIDELADLMMVAPHDVEDSIQRLTQKARAAGIHLLVATQRPTTDVVKGTIKSNIPARIAFKVSSFVDSTTILDGAGAETLLGKGDMLLKRADRTHRLQGAFIPDDEIYAVTDFIRKQSEPDYIFEHDALKQQLKNKQIITDDLFSDVARFVVSTGSSSINTIQKEFEIGFNRAQRLFEMMEEFEIVSKGQGTKAREVLVTPSELEDILADLV